MLSTRMSLQETTRQRGVAHRHGYQLNPSSESTTSPTFHTNHGVQCAWVPGGAATRTALPESERHWILSWHLTSRSSGSTEGPDF